MKEREWLGRYMLGERIARGGMGEIHEAFIEGDPFKRVVLKIVRTKGTDRSNIQMFLDEARVSTLIRHPNIVRVYEVNFEKGTYYMVMEYLEGWSLARVMGHAYSRRERLPLRVVLRVGLDVCSALSMVHDAKTDDGHPLDLVHRDVSPGNLFVTKGGLTKLLDFGIAKSKVHIGQTNAKTIKGTAPYMSPEQVRNKDLDRRSDIFSFGVIMHEMISGKRLFHRENVYETIHAVCYDPCPVPERLGENVPPELVEATMRALAREPSQRLDTARELEDVLLRAVAAVGGDIHHPEVSKYVLTPSKSRRATAEISDAAKLEFWADTITDVFELTDTQRAHEREARPTDPDGV